MSNKRLKLETNELRLPCYDTSFVFTSLVEQAEHECNYYPDIEILDANKLLANKPKGTFFFRRHFTELGNNSLLVCYKTSKNERQLKIIMDHNANGIRIDKYTVCNLKGYIEHNAKKELWTIPYTEGIPYSWVIRRLLWIAIMKEDKEQCIMAILSKDIIKEISKYLLYFPLQQSRDFKYEGPDSESRTWTDVSLQYSNE